MHKWVKRFKNTDANGKKDFHVVFDKDVKVTEVKMKDAGGVLVNADFKIIKAYSPGAGPGGADKIEDPNGLFRTWDFGCIDSDINLNHVVELTIESASCPVKVLSAKWTTNVDCTTVPTTDVPANGISEVDDVNLPCFPE